MLSVDKQSIAEHHKRQFGAPAVENAIQIGTNIILYWVKTVSPPIPTSCFQQLP